jgi:cyclopropane-fatty-acyl-phospholipid synthase
MSSAADAGHSVGASAKNEPATDFRVHPIVRWLACQLLGIAGNPPVGIVLWDGKTISSSDTEPLFKVRIHDPSALLKLILNPDLQFGQLYQSGRIDVDGDLTACLEALYRAIPDFPNRSLPVRMLSRLYLLRRNTLTRAENNIHHHYDISNDFYRLWLDKEMVYTCAYFPDPAMSLEEAQIAKLDHVCRKLRLKPGDHVVEAGCGWGGLALHMARYYGVRVKAYNISKEQIGYALERARREGLDGQVEFIQGDYRRIEGRFDVFVSVGMCEHVGVTHFGELGEVINRCLKPDGRGLIHTIGRNRPAPMNAWIEKRIFPGAYPPSLGEMMRIFEPWRFSVLDVENLRLHYALTLRHWLDRFEAAAHQVAAMFDQEFVRAWRLYLAGSIAAFSAGELQLFQIVFAHHDNNEIPRSRDFLYAGS